MAIRPWTKARRSSLGRSIREEANAAGVAVANSRRERAGLLEQRPIAGGNVFVLGQTFDNTAKRRLAGYAVRNGKSRS
jgi:hypothetical protein